MRTPPVCRSRLVGFRISSDRDGSVRLTRAASVMPNASISSGLAFGSGKCNRVADATPSSAWHPRHWAASKIGYTVRVNETPGGLGACPSARTPDTAKKPMAASPRSANTHHVLVAQAFRLRSSASRASFGETRRSAEGAKAVRPAHADAAALPGCPTRLAGALVLIFLPGLRDTFVLLPRAERHTRR